MPILPIKDYNPLTVIRFQYVTVAIIAISVVVFLWQTARSPESGMALVYGLGMIPAVVLGNEYLTPELVLVPPAVTLFTSMFLHGGWLHLLGNMLYLWIFGDNVEDAMGHGRFIVFYLLSGLAAAFAQIVVSPDSVIPTIGASGAISGILGAYLILHPRTRVLVFLLPYFPLHLPAYIVLGFWIILQFLFALGDMAGEAGVAWWAHVGGFVAGMALIGRFRRPDVPLFDRPPGGSSPWGDRNNGGP